MQSMNGEPMKLKTIFVAFALSSLAASSASAAVVDIIGGPGRNTQTMHHCGMLPMSTERYTSSPTLVRMVEYKLQRLGYAKAVSDGVYAAADVAAMKRFQADQGLPTNGIVDGLTAQRLAYASHPSANVHRCEGEATAWR